MPYNQAALEALADSAFEDSPENPLNETHALVASVDGEVVFERYRQGLNADTTFLSWSIAKSVASALCGVLVSKGMLDLDAPAPVAAWAQGDDPRHAITLRQLLQMRSGLQWNEDYIDGEVSNVIEMLFGSGSDDVAGYAAALGPEHAPGAEWLYSSGTTNIIARILGDAIGGGQAGLTKALVDDFLQPAGMHNVTLRFDDADTWIASSFLYATARDYVAFGELFRNEGMANGTRLLAQEWITESIEDHATCPESGQGYGLQWWLTRDTHGSYSANGYEGQRVQVTPSLGLTFVRFGKTGADYNPQLRAFFADVTNCFA